MQPAFIFILIAAFCYGLIIGSFLNVCILRIPEGKTIVTERSHCMKCGYQLSWYDMIPVASYLALRGRCRKCRTKISAQYPLIEGANGILYVIVFLVCGVTWTSVIYCLLGSALIVLTVIDFRTYEIPFGINLFILLLGLIHMVLEKSWPDYVIGLLAVSLPLEAILLISGGRAIGGGDVRLMAAAGLLLGWRKILLAFLLGCVAGSVIHLIRMKVSDAEHVLALGPYLSLGIMLSALWGDVWIQTYLQWLLN
ncbi:MAG: prepilin peptidase [Muribaculaceae bacterium]|nr:prepilin peptidase [Roseburia sp.]MCM1430497.1 prepilin peptidase [Muribaculaceae bacterium]MCM1493170.1 prepilin peptidase [Muribaculaceae bacterium]